MKTLIVKNFKSLKKLHIESLSRVNLIVGKNNVGKSTLLEAISIYLSEGDEEWIRKILDNRGETIIRNIADSEENEIVITNHFLSLFSGREENYSSLNEISIGEGEDVNNSVKLNLVYLSEINSIDESGIERRRIRPLTQEDITSDIDKNNIVGKGILIKSNKYSYIIPFYRPRSIYSNAFTIKKFQYVRTMDFNTNKNAELFDRISLSPEEKYIIQALNIINPKINKLNFLNSEESRKPERIPIVTLKGDSNKYRLSSMGDGINRILTIILSLLNCRNGVLLLDEFETGLHYTVQDELWKIIFMLSEKLNIQVFVTSHSNDCIRSFARTNDKGLGKLIRLEERENQIVAMSYNDNNDILFATENDVELR